MRTLRAAGWERKSPAILAQAGDLLSCSGYLYLCTFICSPSRFTPTCFAMAAAEPSRLQLEAMRLVGDAMDWVPINPPLRPVVLGGLGVEDAEPIRALAAIAEQDLLRARAAMQVGGVALNPAAKGKVVLCGGLRAWP